MSSAASMLVAVAATGTIFSDYPGFLSPHATVEAWTDRGPIIEIIVKCPSGTGILSYSKIEGSYCSAKHDCSGSLARAIRSTCR